MLSLHALPAFNDNYIWALAAPDGRAVIVDPGQADPVRAAADAGLRPVALLLTHHHADHIGAVPELLQRWPVPVYAPHDDRIADASDRTDDKRVKALAVGAVALTGKQAVDAVVSHFDAVASFGETLPQIRGQALLILDHQNLHERRTAWARESAARVPGKRPLGIGDQFTGVGIDQHLGLRCWSILCRHGDEFPARLVAGAV